MRPDLAALCCRDGRRGFNFHAVPDHFLLREVHQRLRIRTMFEGDQGRNGHDAHNTVVPSPLSVWLVGDFLPLGIFYVPYQDSLCMDWRAYQFGHSLCVSFVSKLPFSAMSHADARTAAIPTRQRATTCLTSLNHRSGIPLATQSFQEAGTVCPMLDIR